MIPTNVSVSRETAKRLETFVDLFSKWSKTFNLVAPSTKQQIWERHVLDSLQLRDIVTTPQHWIDLGSGGGFPGIITSIVLAEHGEGHVDLVESNNKKAAFLRMALLQTQGRGSVHTIRIEDAAEKIQAPDLISARALAELDLLLRFVEPWSKDNRNLRCLFHKGRDYQAEVDKARGRWDFDLIIHRSAVEEDSVILDISSLQRRG
ncbi:16S rRNA (guanine(527)-N(7))-methyltransferase RsmG [Peteryoungia desertarenae]|uniref:Ribosomal RNA small subunit methyltransferase G n=1 Tax=Peteryoungia desertarenae TaxID=1813451 RepID=A0ABX6QJX1_9HYPH|nr:16S rRNA (guanine(527)-N(7))-methyltransferase RsmG [Peteryoungia desertarenae]